MISNKVLDLLPPMYASESLKVEAIKGDASKISKNRTSEGNFKRGAIERNYYRVYAADHSFILMEVNREGIDNQPFESLDLFTVRNLLEKITIPVPDIIAYKEEDGLILMSDLGDTDLWDYVHHFNDPHLAAAILGNEKKTIDFMVKNPLIGERLMKDYYQKAIDYILQWQRLLLDFEKYKAISSAVFGRFFDREKFLFELDFFLNYFIEQTLGIKLSDQERKDWHDAFDAIIDPIVQGEMVFTHRDYHSRNLLIHHHKLWVIDYQDARLGNCWYDLASLIYDAYVNLKDIFRSELRDYFLSHSRIATKAKKEDPTLENFYLTAIQRNLKAIGSFGYMNVVKGNPTYLTYVDNVLGYLESHCELIEKKPLIRHLKAWLPRVKEGMTSKLSVG